MNFSNNAFRPNMPAPKVSEDTMSHANLVMACRWGWTSTPDSTGAMPRITSSISTSSPSPFNNVRSKRFAPCQGRLYHQLLCSHRIRTDLVEDCGVNCVEPFAGISGPMFICHECLEAEATKIWEDRKAQHLASYPPVAQMTKEQYDQYYLEHQQLEAEYARDRRAYESELKAKTRPTNVCSALETSKEENDFATELDSLALSLMGSNDNTMDQPQVQPQARARVSLPTDASEQLHWNLNTLALDRGSCGVEYSPNRVTTPQSPRRDELWSKPRG